MMFINDEATYARLCFLRGLSDMAAAETRLVDSEHGRNVASKYTENGDGSPQEAQSAEASPQEMRTHSGSGAILDARTRRL
jgi:hypothetical protein